jgi:putative methylase
MKLKELEITLERLQGFSHPSARLEQYQTPAPLSARLLFDAFMRADIGGKRVCDLGSGTGVLAIGAALLGAVEVIGLEIDSGAVRVARENAASLDVAVEFFEGDVRDPSSAGRLGQCDTVVMNPPFGAQNVHADRPFIDLSLQIGQVTYGIFNAGSRQFVQTYTAGRGTITDVIGGKFPIRRTFAFHRKDRMEIEVEILRIASSHA